MLKEHEIGTLTLRSEGSAFSVIMKTDGSFAALVSTLMIVTKLFSIPREAAEAKAAAEQSQAASSLPPEPAQNCGQSVANLRSVLRVKSMLQLKHYILLFVEVFQVEVDENISVCYVYSGSSVIISVCLFVLEHIKTSA